MRELLSAITSDELRRCELCGSDSWRVLHEGDESNCECVGECLRVCDNPEILEGCDGVARPLTTSYDYRVLFIGNYWELSTRVSVSLSGTIGNLSEEARELVEEEASTSILGELGIAPLGFAHSCLVTLLLDGEEVELG